MKKAIIILSVLSVSLSAILVRYSNAPSMVLALYRMLFSVILLLPFVLIKFRRELLSLKIKQILVCALSGIFLGMHFTLYFESLKYTNISSSVVLVDTEVFFVAFAMLIFFKEKISTICWIGVGLTFLGSVIIALADTASGSNILLGDIIALAGAFCMSVYTIIGKKCRTDISTTVYTFIVYISAGITVFIILMITETPVIGYDNINLLTALGMAVFCTLLGHSIFSWGLKYIQASFISTAKLLEPIFATVLGIFLFNEIPGIIEIIGGCIVISGIFIYSMADRKNGRLISKNQSRE